MNLFENLQLMKEADEFTRYKYSGPIYLNNFKNKRQIGEIREPIFALAKSLRDAYDKFIMGIVTFNTYLIDHQNLVQIDKDKIEVIDSFPDKAEDNLPIIENINMNLLKEDDQDDSEHIYKIDFKLDISELYDRYEYENVSITIENINVDDFDNAFDDIEKFEKWYNDYDDENPISVNYIKSNIDVDDTITGEYIISLNNKLDDEDDFLRVFFDFIDCRQIKIRYNIDGQLSHEYFYDTFDGPQSAIEYNSVDFTEEEFINIDFEYKTIKKVK